MTKADTTPAPDAAQAPAGTILTGAPAGSRYALNRIAKHILSEAAARDQLMELLDYYDIDMARVNDPDTIALMDRHLDHLTDFIRTGKIEVRRGANEAPEVHHTLASGAVIVYQEIGAKAKLAMDKYSATESYARTYAFMGSLGGVGSEGITQLGPKDLAVVEVLGPVFMNA